jgi:hypothetical protein
MGNRIRPLRPGESPDPDVNTILESAVAGWWEDSSLFGVVAHRPGLLKSIVAVFREMFESPLIETHIRDLMRIRTAYEWG